MPLPHAYTSLCTVQHRQRVVKLASPCPLLHASSTVPHLHCTAHPPRPAPPRPAVIMGDGAHIVELSAHASRISASGEADVVADGTHPAGGIAAAEWLAATFGGSDVSAGGTGARTSTVDDGHFPSFKGRDTSASPSSFLPIVHNDDVDITPLLSLQNTNHGGSGEGKKCDGVDRGVTHARLYYDAQSDDDKDGPVNTLEAVLGHMSQQEDAGYDNDGLEVSVSVRC